MLLMNFKERWRAAELSSAIEVSLKPHSVWVGSSYPRSSLETICRKISLMVINDFRRVDNLPKYLSEQELMSTLFNSFSILINNSLNGEILTKDDYIIIALAREFSALVDQSHQQDLINHAASVIQLSNNWDKHIIKSNQRANIRFTV
ncbi:hypothetical protein [Shewanella sp. 10N.286.48.A6]|uniref:hypothetical protein n=1 Tax=Shewanella sp. 10N.286.48.A6 TaxID=1880833 RepID=UPI000C83D6E4|nr:hypothetical protein [Shewanella sp. 10N.286.48.A6]PMI02080.1 hypothetical protein BCU55_07855 [Shewanella sp. 10N.286.48.A6]